MPEISIIIPCFDGERYIEETVRSALDQALDADSTSHEVVVVDDGSTDRSAAIVARMAASDSRLRVIRRENRGVARARNAGLAACDRGTRYVMFLDADDVLVDSAVARLSSRLEADPTLVAAFGPCSRIDSSGVQISPPEEPVNVREAAGGAVTLVRGPDRVGYWRMLPVTPISTPGQVLIRRDALTQADPFDPATVPCEDWDLWLRLARVGDFGVVAGEVLRYRDHISSASKRYALMMKQRETVLKKQRSLVAPSERRDLRVAWRYAMYRFDADLCRTWAVQQLAEHNLVGAMRYAVRSARFTTRMLVATAAGQPRGPR
ncbi:MAG: glycosyltransferase [Acidimicrobiaceae bacterium]|nr:glycosyltransferase [Acidimicrobiaceae bacterium]